MFANQYIAGGLVRLSGPGRAYVREGELMHVSGRLEQWVDGWLRALGNKIFHYKFV